MERALLRIGAVSATLGVILLFVANAFHGDHDPADLITVLPESTVKEALQRLLYVPA